MVTPDTVLQRVQMILRFRLAGSRSKKKLPDKKRIQWSGKQKIPLTGLAVNFQKVRGPLENSQSTFGLQLADAHQFSSGLELFV
ncbi:hypothetical protein N7495_008255 [Penicillium taxi]|uniref:uncharacterized protein n=1 Tax=Penicillium taxi TaxID=168475 RepID=UPI0025456AAF|nr:uncharacterized protein N7495_008255 [Penicillium taxi]KAJ5888214.1 hypothetical protein N7495_008255 [Penicillium taxi]